MSHVTHLFNEVPPTSLFLGEGGFLFKETLIATRQSTCIHFAPTIEAIGLYDVATAPQRRADFAVCFFEGSLKYSLRYMTPQMGRCCHPAPVRLMVSWRFCNTPEWLHPGQDDQSPRKQPQDPFHYRQPEAKCAPAKCHPVGHRYRRTRRSDRSRDPGLLALASLAPPGRTTPLGTLCRHESCLALLTIGCVRPASGSA